MLIYAEAGLCSNEVPAAVAEKLEKEAAQHWDRFYRNNADRFYKDRHYFDREFPDLLHGTQVILEVSIVNLSLGHACGCLPHEELARITCPPMPCLNAWRGWLAVHVD